MVKNKTILGVLTLLLGLALTASAENYPYRSDVLWVTVPNHADWLYQTGEKATVEVQFYKYGIPQDGVTVCYELGDDMMPSDTKGSVTLKNGRAVVTIGTMKQPGFRDCRLQATIAGKTYKHHVKVGFSPDKLQPYTKMPADFDEFWDKSKSEIATFPLLYTKERVEKYSTDKIDCYLVKLQLNNRGQSIYGYLTCPRNMQKGACPVVLCPPVQESKPSKPLFVINTMQSRDVSVLRWRYMDSIRRCPKRSSRKSVMRSTAERTGIYQTDWIIRIIIT